MTDIYPVQNRVVVKALDLDLALKILENIHIEDFPDNYQDAIRNLRDTYDQKNEYAVFRWTDDDVIQRMNMRGYTNVPDRQIHVHRILRLLESEHDAEIGICWDTIDIWIDHYFKEHTKIERRDPSLCGHCDERRTSCCDECGMPLCDDHAIEDMYCLDCADDIPEEGDLGQPYYLLEFLGYKNKFYTETLTAKQLKERFLLDLDEHGIELAADETFTFDPAICLQEGTTLLSITRTEESYHGKD
jgi:hypothetical protein